MYGAQGDLLISHCFAKPLKQKFSTCLGGSLSPRLPTLNFGNPTLHKNICLSVIFLHRKEMASIAHMVAVDAQLEGT